jgi:phospholipid transport system substrate-binding protein
MKKSRLSAFTTTRSAVLVLAILWPTVPARAAATEFTWEPSRGSQTLPRWYAAGQAAGLATRESKKGTKTPKAEGAAPNEGTAVDTRTPPSHPMADLKRSDGALKKLFARRAPSWSPEASAERDEMRKIVATFLDFEELSKRSLARHWDSLSGKERTDFVSTLRDLIERSYIRQVHGAPNYDLTFEKETVDGNEADVTATLHGVVRGKKVDVAMEYKLLAKDGRWLVYDVITDEQSMLENYRAEFNKIINKESFDALLKRMKKKLEQKD